MTKRKKFFIKRTIELMCIIGIIVMFVWLIASIIDTNLCNNPVSEKYQEFAQWNLIEKLLG